MKNGELDFLRKEFKFQENDFEYCLIKEETQNFYKGKNLLIYRNENAEKQIEICGGDKFFHCIIRKIENNQLSEYSDEEKNISFEDLAIIDNQKYDHFDFYAGGKIGVNGVTKNTVGLFKRQRDFLIAKDWIDLEKVEQLKNEDFKSQFSLERPKKKKFFIDEIKEMVIKVYPDIQLVFNNRVLPFYHEDSTTEKLKYNWKGNKITIEQNDWRDYRRTYSIFVNDKKLTEIDINGFKNKQDAIEEIKKTFNALFS